MINFKSFLKGLSVMSCLTASVFTSGISNVYADGDFPTSTVLIPVTCTAEGTTEEFTYTITSEYSTGHDFVESDTIKLSNGKSGSFVINYDLPSTYSYTIEQTKGSDKDTTYDTTVYDVDVYVTEDEQGVLHASPIVYKDGKKEKVDSVAFTNTVKKTSIFGNKDTGVGSAILAPLTICFGSVMLMVILAMTKKREQKED